MDYATVLHRIGELSEQFAEQRSERQLRRSLRRPDFDLLRDAGFPLMGLPQSEGGLWQSVTESTRPACELLRVLARGDSSVALVSAMHPAVLSYWLTAPESLANDARWQQQCRGIFDSVQQGHWWGTITSEPGSGGDVTRSRTVATPTESDLEYHISGQKHFGSGSGVTSFIVTTAVPAGEKQPEWFFVDMRGKAWDGSDGVKLIAEWDGHGMTATQSHAIEFANCPATRMAWPNSLLSVSARAGAFIGCLFTSVIVGITDVAMSTARQKLDEQDLGAYESVEWTKARMDHWLICQAYEGMIRAIESQPDPREEVLLGKTAVSELAEQLLTRLCRTLGGSTFARRSPFGFWFEDVRALGFLRPPWGLAYQTLAKLRSSH